MSSVAAPPSNFSHQAVTESAEQDVQASLRSQVRALQAEIESNLATLQQVRAELSSAGTAYLSSQSTNGAVTLSAEKLDELGNRASEASRSIRTVIPIMQQYEQDLLGLAQAPQHFGQIKRFQDISQSLMARHRNISTAVDNLLHARRVELLLQKHKDHRDGDDTQRLDGTTQQQRDYLMKERNALNTTIDIIAESIATAKASYNNLSHQGSKLRGVGKTATTIVTQVTDINALMGRIRLLQRKHQVILLATFIVCLTITLILTYNRIF
eukprot:Blabericola_migrator_1__2832@NODE_180_length_11882_cov_134_948540_g18_i1_p6_GENE_NODE_180_length_11882_cov_134_948540_g18_i1NODE_180_length_11882_cov_134_948540_g18_i1_p6_ORF_typecomplete_len269_score31_86VSNARE_C/PF12352_8/7_5e03VSNARE_C/PF12352_8/4_2e06MAD/PF05557_13/0_02Sec20/PF03908_13/1e02Sec20/PF03908_13/0_048AAA_13/PF13166_6/0_16Nepo_coat_N/PF03689_15/3_9e03Nepo_coat_N/PF03689_15/0_36Laminin_II/PF06009_12/1_1e02Laminin_II/PF06009_12/1_7Tropomyosin_1/PF12718_7/0_1Tropomyosin_1/PF12718_7/1_